ncbi:MAG: ribose-phosphate pyrophosphokinase [Nitrososphaerota archaeon]|nr:ribose-phosphate pyrophosphokinase [Nitrososphaerota archaeon]
MSEIVIVPGSSNAPLAFLIARRLGVKPARAEIRRFPDSEKYVRIDSDVNGKNVFIVQSMHFKPDEYIIESLLLASAARDAGASSVSLVAPYFAYARQDERFKPGEAISVAAVAGLLNASGISSLITVDVHRHRILDFSSVFNGKWIDVSVMPDLTKYAASQGLINDKTVIVGPDGEAIQWAKIAAESVGVKEYGALQKKRYGDEDVKVSGSLDLKGKNVFVVDDIISTGGTIIEASKLISDGGGKLKGVACAHGLFVNEALYKLYSEGITEIISSDTVPNQTTRVSSAEALSKGILSIVK